MIHMLCCSLGTADLLTLCKHRPVFSSNIWWMSYIWSAIDLLHRNPQWRSPANSSAFGVNVGRRMLDTVLCVWMWRTSTNTAVYFTTVTIKRYNDWLLQLLKQLFLISNIFDQFMDFKYIFLPPACIISARIW